MLTVGFNKLFPMSLSSHLDMARAILRALNRAELPIEYSKGFNPHKEIYYTPPLPLGVGSRSEYMTVYTDVSAQEFLKRYNQNAVKGLEAFSARGCIKNPNLAGILAAADYEIKLDEPQRFEKAVRCMLEGSEFVLEFENKEGIIIRRDVRNKIYKAELTGDKIKLMLSAGNDNLRVDKLFQSLCRTADVEYFAGDIIRTELYALQNGVYKKYSELF